MGRVHNDPRPSRFNVMLVTAFVSRNTSAIIFTFFRKNHVSSNLTWQEPGRYLGLLGQVPNIFDIGLAGSENRERLSARRIRGIGGSPRRRGRRQVGLHR
jgi:hypothetical protein